MLPTDRAQSIIIGTNFGLLLSDDGGAHGSGPASTERATVFRYALSSDGREVIAISATNWSSATTAVAAEERRQGTGGHPASTTFRTPPNRPSCWH